MKARIINEPVKVTSEADVNSSIITELAVGTEVELGILKKINDEEKWVSVTLSTGQQGFLPAKTPVFLIKWATLMQENVNVYAEPSAQSPIKTQYEKNTTFYVTDIVKQDNINWAKIRDSSGNEGYIEGQTRIKYIPKAPTVSGVIKGKVFVEETLFRSLGSNSLITGVFPEEMRAKTKQEADAIARLSWEVVAEDHVQSNRIYPGSRVVCKIKIWDVHTGQMLVKNELMGVWANNTRSGHGFSLTGEMHASPPVGAVRHFLSESIATKACPNCKKSVLLMKKTCESCGYQFTEAELLAENKAYQERIAAILAVRAESRRHTMSIIGWIAAVAGTLVTILAALFAISILTSSGTADIPDWGTGLLILFLCGAPEIIMLVAGIFMILKSRKRNQRLAHPIKSIIVKNNL